MGKKKRLKLSGMSHLLLIFFFKACLKANILQRHVLQIMRSLHPHKHALNILTVCAIPPYYTATPDVFFKEPRRWSKSPTKKDLAAKFMISQISSLNPLGPKLSNTPFTFTDEFFFHFGCHNFYFCILLPANQLTFAFIFYSLHLYEDCYSAHVILNTYLKHPSQEGSNPRSLMRRLNKMEG